eukprot:SAG25_NODE_325_length_9774_cov_10.836899_4_plen_99_part_00
MAPPKLCESSCQTGEPTAIVLQAPPQGGSAAATPQGSSSIIINCTTWQGGNVFHQAPTSQPAGGCRRRRCHCAAGLHVDVRGSSATSGRSQEESTCNM